MPSALTFPQSLFSQHSPQKKHTDSGSPESQVALFTHRIKHLTNHLKERPKDNSCKLAIKKLSNNRKRQLRYLAQKSPARHQQVMQDLQLRK